MYKRFLAGLVALTMVFTSVPYPDTVQASQVSEEVAVEDTEEFDVAEEIELLEELEAVLEQTESEETVTDVENDEAVEGSEVIETTESITENSEVVEEQMSQTEKVESTEVEAADTEKVDTETEEEAEVEESTEEATAEDVGTEEITETTEEIDETEDAEEDTEAVEETEEIEEVTEETEETMLENEISVKGTNSFGNLLASEITEVSEEQAENNGCNVFSIEMVDSSAVVSFETVEDCTLVVGVYDEAGVKMLAAGSLEVYSGETSAVVDIETDSMPQYFYLRGFLVETDTFRPLCTSYESPMYTQEMQEFLAKTTADFDEEKVLNLDEDTTNNFAVYSDETVIVEEAEGSNEVVTADEETSTYVFENADESITSLQVGDIFAYESTDGEVLIIKVGSIVIDGTTVTITGTDTSMEEVFEYVKIDADAGTADAEIDASTCDEGVTYEGLVDYTEEGEAQTYAVDEEVSASMALSMKLDLAKKGSENLNVKITGGINFKVDTTIKVYIASDYQYFEFKMGYSSKLDVTVSGAGKFQAKLPAFVMKPMPAVVVSCNPKFETEVSAKLEFSGTLKGAVGFSVSSDTGFKSLNSNPKLITELKIEGEFFIGFVLEPEVAVEIVKVKLIEASLEGKIGVEFTGEVVLYTDDPDDVIHECQSCIKGEHNAVGEVSIKVKLLKTQFKWDMIKSKIKLCDWYWSFTYGEGGWTTCPHMKYRVDVTVLDKSSEPIAGSKIAGDFSVITGQGTLASATQLTTGEDGKAVGYLAKGKHTLMVTKDGYETIKKKITVRDDGKDVVVRLKALSDEDDGSDDSNIEDGEEIGGKKVNKIDLGFHVGVITEDNCLYEWETSDSPIKNPAMKIVMDNVVEVSIGTFQHGAISKDRSLYMWGFEEQGELGNGGEKDDSLKTPFKIMDNVEEVCLGEHHSAAITEDGSLYMWGLNSYGQLGDGTTTDRYAPIKIMDDVVDVSLGRYHSAAITEDGSLYMWGWNYYGQIGNSSRSDVCTPMKILDNVVEVSLGEYHSGAITDDSTLYTWGRSSCGQLGIGYWAYDCLSPQKVMDGVSKIEFGGGCSGAITEDGKLYMWGENSYGQLGIGGTVSCAWSPKEVMSSVREVSLNGTCSGAITEDGKLYMWGQNRYEDESSGEMIREECAVPILITIKPESVTLFSEDILSNMSTPEFSTLKAATITTSENSTTQTASFTDLLPNELYNFYIMKSKSGENLLGSDNLLYIGQSTSDASGAMSIVFEAKESYDDAEIFVVGITKSDISGASVKVPNLEYDGTEKYVTPQVTLNGVQLVEGKDYELTSGYSASKVGTYTVTLTGIGLYTGTVTASYQMVCTHTYGGNWTVTKAATCTTEGSKYRTCTKCNAKGNVTVIERTGHTYKDVKVTKKATTKKNGSVNQKCSACGKTRTAAIYAAKTAKLSTTSYTYNGKARKPSVTVTDSKGNKLKNKTDYTVSYAKGRKNVGEYTVTIKLKGKYSGTIKKTFTIKPKTTSISKVTAAKKGFTVKWKKQNSQTTGYEIQYSTSSKFTKQTTKTVKITKNSTTSKKITKLKAKKKYYVRVRTYKTVKINGKSTKIYSDWSKTKKVTTKK